MSAPHGYHWSPCPGSGKGKAVALAVVVAVLVIAGGGPAVAGDIATALLAAVILVGVVIVAGVAVAVVAVKRKSARDAQASVDYAARMQVAEDRKHAEALERHQRALELARASAPVVNVTNTVDPAGLIAAALTAGMNAAQPARQPAPVVIRGEVER